MGSVDESRAGNLSLQDVGAAREACVELGRELASAGWDIVVYSAKAGFIEGDFVRGYVSASAAAPGSIHVHAPLGKGDFDEIRDRPELFDVRADPSRDWEVSFYRSLAQCDGVLVVGGGRSTLVTGLIALTIRMPVLPVTAFGGSARKVWERLANDKGFASDDDIAEMAAPWRDGSAQRLVASLGRQRESRAAQERDELRRTRTESRRTHLGLAAAAALLLASVAGLAATWGSRPGSAGSIAMLVLVPTLAAAGGALIRTSLDATGNRVRAGVLGGAAGLITGLLYVVSQLLGAPDLLGTAESVRRLLFFVLPIGFVAGLTFDAVYAKFRGADVSQAGMLERLQ